MANQNRFATTPTISISRSKFVRKSQRKTTIKIGEITPIYLDEVLPGDTRKIDIASLIRGLTMVVPIMDNIHCDLFAFYAPNRILWTHWKEFMGENNTSAGVYQGTEYTIPANKLGYDYDEVGVGSLGDHLGLPLYNSNKGTDWEPVSALPLRMYKIIYNEWFRDQNLIAPVSVSLGDTSSDLYSMSLYKAAKDHDYFTSCLPYAQKGAPVTIPLGFAAPVIGVNEANTSYTGADISMKIAGVSAKSDAPLSWFADSDHKGGVYADLSQATAATINDLRFAFQYQKLLERDALYGTRYWEILKGHFGVSAPDASLQRPELLGHRRIHVNIDQVLQTTGSDVGTPSSNTLGNPGSISVTGDVGNVVSKSFTEHGYIMILAVFRHDQTYGQGINKMWSRSVRTDFYFPEFANLGAQKVLNKEIYQSGHSSTDMDIFGYQEAWAEYRFKPSECTGLVRPDVNGIGFWTLANNFGSTPTLSQSFIEQGSANLHRSTNGAAAGYDFICDFAFKDIAVRPMPMYSIPGLIDHH